MLLLNDFQDRYRVQITTTSIRDLEKCFENNSEEKTIEFLNKYFQNQKSEDFIPILSSALGAEYYEFFSALLDHIPEARRHVELNVLANALISHSLPLALCKKLDHCGWDPSYFNTRDEYGVTLLAKLAKSGNGDALFFRSIVDRIGIENIDVFASPNFDKTELNRCLHPQGEQLLATLKSSSRESLPMIAHHGCTITIPQNDGSMLQLHGLTVQNVIRYLRGDQSADSQGRAWNLIKQTSRPVYEFQDVECAQDLIKKSSSQKSSQGLGAGLEVWKLFRADAGFEPPHEEVENTQDLTGFEEWESSRFDTASPDYEPQDVECAQDLIKKSSSQKSSQELGAGLEGWKPSRADAGFEPPHEEVENTQDPIKKSSSQKSSQGWRTSFEEWESSRFDTASPDYEPQDVECAQDLIKTSSSQKSSQGLGAGLEGWKLSRADAGFELPHEEVENTQDLIKKSSNQKSSQGWRAGLEGWKPFGADAAFGSQQEEVSAWDLIKESSGQRSSQNSQTHLEGSKSSSEWSMSPAAFVSSQKETQVGGQPNAVPGPIWIPPSPQTPRETCPLRSHVWFRTHVAPNHGALSIQNPNTGKFHVIGLYPAKNDHSYWELLKGVPCRVMDDTRFLQKMQRLNADITTQFLIPYDKAENIVKYAEAAKNDCESGARNYMTIGGNCLDFVQSAYKNGNLSSVEHYGKFIQASDFGRFVSLNWRMLPIQYTLLRSHGVISTIAENLLHSR